MVRGNHVFSCKKNCQKCLSLFALHQKNLYFCNHIIVPTCATLHRDDNDAPKQRYFYPPKKHLIKHEDKGSRRDP